MVLLESSEGRKHAPWMLQLVFNKILTFPLDQFWVEKHGCGGGREGGRGNPPLLFTLKAIPFQANSYDCGCVCLHGKHILQSIGTICNSNEGKVPKVPA